jgi:hypothetical protein
MAAAVFVGRESELARTSQALDDVLGGEGRVLFFVGEPGIGKTRLAQAVERSAVERGLRPAWGRCWEAGGAPPFWPWSQVFETLGLVTPLGAMEGGVLGARELRFQQFERARRALAELAASTPLAILLDDLHAADVPSLGLLHVLARQIRACRILLIATYRDAEARLGETGALLSTMGREGEVMTLGRLRPEDVTSWVRVSSPDDLGVATRLHALTEGNPLFIHELLRVKSPGSLDVRRLPDGLRTVLREHLALVSPEARELLAAATIFGREFTAADVVAITEARFDDVAARCHEACDAGLVEPADGPERYSFAHVLLRDRLYGDFPPSERAALHWRASEHFASRGDAGTAAHHAFEGLASGNAPRAAEIARQAASSALARLAFEDVIATTTRALAALEGAKEPAREVACELEILRAEARIRVGDAALGQQECVRAAALARSTESPMLEARAALAYSAELASGEVDPTMVVILRQALESISTAKTPNADATRARVMARLATALTPPSAETRDEMLRISREALALARNLGDGETLLYVSSLMMVTGTYHFAREENQAIARDIVDLAARLDRPLIYLHAGPILSCTLREYGLRAEAGRALAIYERVVEELPWPQYRWRLSMLRATLGILDGDLDRAERLGAEALSIATSGGVERGISGWAQHRIALAIARRDPSSIAPDAERLLQIFAHRPTVEAFGLWVLAATGRVDEAKSRFAGLTLDETRTPGVIVAAEVATILGDEAIARRVLAELESRRDLNTVFWGGPAGTTAIGSVARLRGDLAALLGRRVEAQSHYEEALVLARKMGSALHESFAQRGLDALRAPPRGECAHAPRVPILDVGKGTISLTQAGERWTISSFTGVRVSLKDGKGVRYLDRLLRCEGREIHAMELAGMEEPVSDAGSILDPTAKAAYKKRLQELHTELEEASGFADPGRADRARREIDALTEQLATAVGMGGRDRKAAALLERARINVQRRIRAVIEQIEEQDPTLARYLSISIHTGVFCEFRRP